MNESDIILYLCMNEQQKHEFPDWVTHSTQWVLICFKMLCKCCWCWCCCSIWQSENTLKFCIQQSSNFTDNMCVCVRYCNLLKLDKLFYIFIYANNTLTTDWLSWCDCERVKFNILDVFVCVSMGTRLVI